MKSFFPHQKLKKYYYFSNKKTSVEYYSITFFFCFIPLICGNYFNHSGKNKK